MEIKKISWFDDFNCMGGECPQTCCRGWLIPLDEEDETRFKRERGRLALELFVATRAYTSDRMNLGSGECCFHAKSGLCRLQLQKGHEFIPWACRSFPRFYRNYGPFEERYLDLSCIAAAKMFVENAGDLCLARDEDEPATRPCTTNDDKKFLEALINIRKEILSALSDLNRSDDPFDRLAGLTDALYLYACRLQDTYAHGGTYKDLPGFIEFYRENDPGEPEKNLSVNDRKFFPLEPAILTEFVKTAIYHFGLNKTGPELYALLTDALAAAEKYGLDPEGFADKAGDFCKNNEAAVRILAAYMSYFMYQYFLGAYETYSFRKIAALSIIHTNMILLLAVTKVLSGKVLTGDDFAYIIAIYNRKVFFNETIEDDMYRIFEEKTSS